MSDPIVERFGKPLAVDTVGELLRECAANAPTERSDTQNGWGFNFAARILEAAKGSPIHDEAVRVLSRMLREGDGDEVRLAATFLPPDQIDGDALQAALMRLDGKPLAAEAAEQVRRRLGRLVSEGALRYEPKLRFEVGKPGWEDLLGAFVVFDHEWFWDNRERLLGKDPQQAMLRFDFAVRALTREEAAAFRDELRARQNELGQAYVDKLIGLIDYREGENELSRESGVRWQSEPAVID